MYFVYVLRHEVTLQTYVGCCEDLDRRLDEHRRKKSGFKLIYKEMRVSKEDMLRREKYLKSGNGRRALRSLLESLQLRA